LPRKRLTIKVKPIHRKEVIHRWDNGIIWRDAPPKSYLVAPPKPKQEADENHQACSKLLSLLYIYYRNRDIISVRRFPAKYLGARDLWVVLIGARYYATIMCDIEGIYGTHIGTLFYVNDAKKATAIAAFSMEGHFSQCGREGIADYVKLLIKRRKFYQTIETKTQIIAL